MPLLPDSNRPGPASERSAGPIHLQEPPLPVPALTAAERHDLDTRMRACADRLGAADLTEMEREQTVDELIRLVCLLKTEPGPGGGPIFLG